MKNLILLIALVGVSFTSNAQLLIGNNKPLAYLNPALQNYDIEKGVVSLSYLPTPFLKEAIDPNYIAMAEFSLSEDLRLDGQYYKIENKYTSLNQFNIGLSYRLEMDKGNYIILGANVGTFNDKIKLAEFNKIFAPNRFEYTDTLSTGIDVGFGMAYDYNGFSMGLAFSKLNDPLVVSLPTPLLDSMSTSTNRIYLDSMIGQPREKSVFGVQNNINFVYTWDLNKKVNLIHSIHLQNLGLSGVDYMGFQNIAQFNKRHSLGIGVLYDGNIGGMLSAGYGITENIKLDVASFFIQDLNYNATSKAYESDGYTPSIEASVRFNF